VVRDHAEAAGARGKAVIALQICKAIAVLVVVAD
jgi:hypothetical protein